MMCERMGYYLTVRTSYVARAKKCDLLLLVQLSSKHLVRN